MKHTTSYTLLKILLSLIAGLTWISSCTTPPEPGMTEQDQSMRDMSGDMFDMFDMFDVEPDIEPEVDLVDMNTHDMEDMDNTPLEDYEPPELTDEQHQVHTLLLEAYEAACALDHRCFPTIFAMTYNSVEECVLDLGHVELLRHELPSFSISVTEAQTCVQAWQKAECFDVGSSIEIENKLECRFTGMRQPGEHCYHHFACNSGFCSYRNYESSRTICRDDPVCMPSYYEGQPCQERPFRLCPPGLSCETIGGVESCVKQLGAFEGDCRIYDNLARGCYGLPLYCNTDNGICTPYATEGESCEDTSCFSLEKLKCPLFVENPTCEKVPDEDYYIEEGKSCRSRGHRCTPGTECFGQGFETCQKPLPAGSPCIPVFEHCTYGYWCDPDTQRCESKAISNACFQTD